MPARGTNAKYQDKRACRVVLLFTEKEYRQLARKAVMEKRPISSWLHQQITEVLIDKELT